MSNGQTLRLAWKSHLDVSEFDDDDDFFELGGDSLAVLKIVSDLSSAGYALSLTDFYERPTFRGQLALLSKAGPAGPATVRESDAGRQLPLAPLQPVLLLDSLSDPASDAYWLVSAYQFASPLTAAQAGLAWDAMTAENPALRTRFVFDASGASQVVDPDGAKAELRCLASLPFHGETALRDWCAEQTSRLRGNGLDVLVAGWFVADWRETAAAEPVSVLLFAAHHALLDGWSLSQCLGDFVAAVGNPPKEVPVPRPSMAAYVDWCERNGAVEASAGYWRDRMTGWKQAEVLDFARRSMDQVGDVERLARQIRQELDLSASARLSVYCAERGVTQAAFLACLWSRIISRYQESEDICVGLTVNIRPTSLADSLRLSGCLINVVPLLFRSTGRTVVADARTTMDSIAGATEHGHLSYPELCRAAGLASNARLFASTLVFQNFDGDLEALGTGGGSEPLAHEIQGSSGSADPLSLTVGFGARTWLLVEWDESRYDGRVVRKLATTFAHLASFPDEVEDWDGSRLTGAEEAEAVLGTAAEARPWTIADLLAIGADGAVAVTDGDETCTYAELRKRAQAMAVHLRHRLGLGHGSRVAFVGRRGVNAAAAICGAWQAGVTWCAVDAGLPPQRRQQLLDAFRPHRQVSLDDDPWRDGPPATGAGLTETLSPEGPAYLVSTSGSAGTPKAVVLSAGGLAPLVEAWSRAYPAAPEGHRVLQLGSWTADVFLGDLLKALSTGGRLVVCPDERRVDLDHLVALIHQHRISLVESTPTLVRALLRHLSESGEQESSSLRTLIVGSEAFRAEELEGMRSLLWPTVRLVNGYGLSECTIESLVHDATGGHAHSEPAERSRSGLSPIGVPLAGTEVDIVDRAGRRLPRGATGEVRITGPGVGLGYLAEGELRVCDGFGTVNGQRSYRTGDFGSIDPDGSIQFFGRHDSQAKIRGHRIETGEVENALLGLEGVDEVHVRAEGPAGDVFLRAFVGSRGAVDGDRLRDELHSLLPAYAIPRWIDVMERLPRTENGKTDRMGLAGRPLPARPGKPETAADLPLVTAIRSVWEDLLGGPVDPDRSFFDSGGHSILVITLFERLRGVFPDTEFTIADLFRYPTVRRFAQHLDSRRCAAADGAVDGPTDRMAVLRAVERGELTPGEGLRRVKEAAR